MLRKRFYVLLCFGLMFSNVFADGLVVQKAEDLGQVSALANSRNIPVLLFFAARSCEHCERLEEDYLGAMSHNAEYQKKVVIRKVVIDDYDSMQDFDGRKISPEDLSQRFNIEVTPTLLMLNHKGQRLSKNMVGYNNSGFFGAYLDDLINEASSVVQKN